MAGVTTCTATQSASDPRLGAAYDLATMAAAAPVWFHPLSTGCHLMLNSRRWHTATPDREDPGYFTSFTEDTSPNWAIINGPTGQRMDVPGFPRDIPMNTPTTSRTLTAAASYGQGCLWLLNSVPPANMVYDPGFETSGNSTAYAHSGTKSSLLTATGNSYVSESLTNDWTFINCAAGQQFDMEIWMYGDPGNTQNTDWVGLPAWLVDSRGIKSDTYMGTWVNVDASYNGMWTKVTYSLTVPDGYDRFFPYYQLSNTMAAGEKYYFDDPIVRPVPLLYGSVVQSIHVFDNGTVSISAEETLPPVPVGGSLVIFDKGVQFTPLFLVVYGTDAENRIYRVRKPWSQIGFNTPTTTQTYGTVVGTPKGWEYWIGTGYSLNSVEIAPVAGVTTVGPMSFANDNDRATVWMSTVEYSNSVYTGRVWTSVSGQPFRKSPLVIPLGDDTTYLGGGVQLMPELRVNPEALNGERVGIPYVTSMLSEADGASSLVNVWSVCPVSSLATRRSSQ